MESQVPVISWNGISGPRNLFSRVSLTANPTGPSCRDGSTTTCAPLRPCSASGCGSRRTAPPGTYTSRAISQMIAQCFHVLMGNCDDMCLVSTAEGYEYLALSYVWGHAKMLKTTKSNFAALTKKDALRRLSVPATIRDSIDLVCLLGLRYLWVDCLCIIQDDQSSLVPQLRKMASIYENAVLTIAAAYGSSMKRP
ncbi:heterokaryon incompatibility protein-domain-containing protein [Podospora australis]|uniref:Heterokaryon incompatibility protein-domain-containing protein n=1 Tax=Podospora australis TaxID=1536484 RepID=A0AAN7AIV7_9PEZI|nr:heterokaryon incompatibility protein-domain-containing protein [Podospora australis]